MKAVQNYQIKGKRPNCNVHAPSQINGVNLNKVRRETTRYFRKTEGMSERQN
jgi:hypothetical protein